MISRRTALLGGGVLAAGAALLARPRDAGGPYPDYFAGLNRLLRREGIDRPVMLIDLDRLDRNIDRVVRSVAVPPAKTYRIVVKSLPSPALVDYVARRANTKALMLFHRPFLQAMADLRPDADILLGKPLPVEAARHFLAGHRGPLDPSRQIAWLIDDDRRLVQYRELAVSLNRPMRVSLEIDVGLHRGGYPDAAALEPALSAIAAAPGVLEFGGFMGYDAHLMGLPGFLADRERPKVRERYAAAVALLRDRFPSLVSDRLCFNAAGSPTFRDYEGDRLVTDLSAGTCLLKPSHYDLSALGDFEPAAFIASPVLKHLPSARLPALEWTAPLIRAWDVNQAQMYFGYGGNWLAAPESPPGLALHWAYTSSNQQGYTAPASVSLDIDDFIFLRPFQSEAVLLQFGDLVAFRGDRIIERWPVLGTGV